MRKILSICIPTYNRMTELSKIIDSVLSIDRDDFEVVITDNRSTDCTKDMVLSYADDRVRYCCNEVALPPFLNMIRSIFNAKGKYALYCNDRDILYSEGIINLINLLSENEFSFVYSPARSQNNTGRINVFKSGYESLMNQACIHHPTGMVYNRELIAKYLQEDKYEKYLQYINTYDFLMLDLFQYGTSAKYDGGYWGTSGGEYIKKHKSGTRMYFLPEIRETMFYGFVDHIFKENNFRLNLKQEREVLKKLYLEFCFLFCKYKACMADENETAHYGIDTKYITTIEMLKIYFGFFKRSIRYLNGMKFNTKTIQYIKSKQVLFIYEIIRFSLKIDAIILIKCVTRNNRSSMN